MDSDARIAMYGSTLAFSALSGALMAGHSPEHLGECLETAVKLSLDKGITRDRVSIMAETVIDRVPRDVARRVAVTLDWSIDDSDYAS